MELKDVLSDLSYDILQGTLEVEIEDICWDSRVVSEKSLFICVKNKNIDRHEYALSAIEKGAIALVVEREVENIPRDIAVIRVKDSRKAMAIISEKYYGNPSEKLNLVGITGTNGKTSVSYFIYQTLEQLGVKCGLIGTIENSVAGSVLKTNKLNPTTPDSLELQKSFREIVDAGGTHTVMEVTSSALDRDRVVGCNFNVGVFTNLTQDHLEEHGTMENYKNAKLKLFKMCKTAVVNSDDDVSRDIIDMFNKPLITYGISKEADLKAFDIKYSLTKVEFKVKYKFLEKKVQLNVPGIFSVYNALATLGVCLSLGFGIDKIIEAIGNIKGVPGRVEAVSNNKGIVAIVDYAHTPDALEKVLKSLKELSKGKLITVFGCGGDRDPSKREIMGVIAGAVSDYCIITSDNPRTEDPIKILNEVEIGVKKTNCSYIKNADRRKAIYRALEIAQQGDVVIIAGKGHETYQIIGNNTIHFDDREVVREFFNKSI